ncbi:hypothetical protein SAMN06296036_112170 [Pseudobacteriovorax antillogorgiicola]|uniref:Uncharacterized protein n=1 Tax=Pseudobacteriovorax antillogorgiicola TaxID=1513793 RepID=A0A1Y6C861_9BACT|nr:hypothetical protein EDD56_112171 [Pseudobacteriovorax antillogorgiicola]SMF41519.1 hypothetical protein SAMN06296036_112170 [Pseudobacteriovorax antillogorgiicola]
MSPIASRFRHVRLRDQEERLFFYLRTRGGFSAAKNYILNVENPRLVALQCLIIPNSPYASIIFDRAVFMIARLDSKQAIDGYQKIQW